MSVCIGYDHAANLHHKTREKQVETFNFLFRSARIPNFRGRCTALKTDKINTNFSSTDFEVVCRKNLINSLVSSYIR